MTGPVTPPPVALTGNADLIDVWDSADVFIWDSTKPYDATTATPKDTTVALGADWKPCGLMLGDPGVGMSREVSRTDVNSWQQGRVLERVKDPKSSISFDLLETNAVTLDLVDEASVPGIKKRYVALEFTNDKGKKKRWISLAEVRLFVSTNDQTQDVKGRKVDGSLVPVGGKYWTIQITPKTP